MNDRIEIASRVHRACVNAALEAYEDAGIRGLCGEGRWEYAIDALRGLDLGSIVADQPAGDAVGAAAVEPGDGT